MALSATITKDYNYLDTDFLNAYWHLSQVALGEKDGSYVVGYTLTAYPSRSAKQKTESRNIVSQYSIGGSTHYQYDAAIYEFVETIPFENVFPNGIAPTTLDELKSKTYQYIKRSNPKMNFSDVLEEGQEILN